MHLKLRHLEAFHAVMEEGSVSKAAERLCLTQPAVSLALSRLEELVGYSLFHRSKGHFTPRPEARLLHADAELSMMAVEQFSNRARLIKQGGLGLVRAGAIGAMAFGLMPKLAAQFASDHPLVEVDLQVRSSSRIAWLVGNGQLDIGLVEAPAAAASVEAKTFSLPCVCVFPSGCGLESRKRVTPADLAGRRMIGIQESHQIDRQLRAAFAEAGVELRIASRGFFFALVRRMAAEGAGAGIVDALNGRQRLGDGVSWRPFAPEIRYSVALISKRGASLSTPARRFAERIEEELSSAASRERAEAKGGRASGNGA